MLWFSVWLVLVLLTLLGAYLLGRRLWRSGKALAAELGRANDLADRLDALRTELAAKYPPPTPPRPHLDAGPAELTGFLALRHEHLAGISRRKRARVVRATRHWTSIVTPR